MYYIYNIYNIWIQKSKHIAVTYAIEISTGRAYMSVLSGHCIVSGKGSSLRENFSDCSEATGWFWAIYFITDYEHFGYEINHCT